MNPGQTTESASPASGASGAFGMVAARILAGMAEVTVIRFTDRDVVRHSLVQRIVEAYGLEETNGASAKRERTKARET